MKKFIFTLLIIIIAIPAIAKDPKETKEYWKNKTIDEAVIEINKCWNESRTYFKVPEGSKQWNICCAIMAVHNPYGIDMTIEQVERKMKQDKEYYSKYY